jgi:hypothetical protein
MGTMEPIGVGRLSLPGTGRGDRAKRGGRGPVASDRREDGFKNSVEVLVYLEVPEAQNSQPVSAELCIPAVVGDRLVVAAVLAPIHLDHQVVLQTDEIDNERIVRSLTTEMIAKGPPLSEVNPKLDLLRGHGFAHSSRFLVSHCSLPYRTPPTTRLRRAVPPPRAGEGLAPYSATKDRFAC